MKRIVTILFVVSSCQLMAQNNIAHFSFWKPKPGQAKNFETGYKQHLKWHKENGDKWSWYGWYIISGARDDQFVDATFNHNWGDFDNAVKPAEDAADNNLHTYPFGDYVAAWKMARQPNLSYSDSIGLRSKFLRFITIAVSNIDSGKKVLEQLKHTYHSKGIQTFVTYKMVDGGNLNQFVVLIGLNTFNEWAKIENLQDDLSAIEAGLNIKTIDAMTSETLLYRADMSFFPN